MSSNIPKVTMGADFSKHIPPEKIRYLENI